MPGRVYSTAAPVGGWNAREPEALMDEKDAIRLDNWFPGDSEVVGRKGYTLFVSSGIGTGIVKTLAPYSSGGTDKLLACTNGAIYEISSGTASSALASSLTNDEWQYVMFGGRLLMVNGSDAPRDYNGTAIASTSWTGSGLTIANLFAITAFKGRVYLLEKNTQNVWYGGVGAVTGSLTKFDLSGVAGSFGGTVAAIGSVTNDGGDGVDDLLVVMMSTGDTLIYQGSDPGVDFALVGVFRLGSPVGRRPLVRIGGELSAITRDGLIPMARMLRTGRAKDDTAMTDKIRSAFDDSLATFGTDAGWEVCFYPLGNKLFVNIPISGGNHQQYVMNTATGAWCRYVGINAYTWCVFNDELYFGGKDGKVYQAETGFSDNGTPILLDGQQAYTFMRARGVLKLISAMRLTFRASSNAQASLILNTDFNNRSRSVSFKISSGVATSWDEAEWDSFTWGGAEKTIGKWKYVVGKGYCASVRVTASVNTGVAWQDTSYQYQSAGML